METQELYGELRSKALEILSEHDPDDPSTEDELTFYAWPQVFGSTAGPRKGYGGQMITQYTVFVFVGFCGHAAAYCKGVWKVIDRRDFKPLMRIQW